MSSGFISEAEIEKKRKERQEEWERVRKPDDPLEAPQEEAVDTRSLYERLKEQRDKKEEEFQEAHKLKNLVKVLDDDEIDFLDFVDRAKLEEEKRKRMEELKEISEFRDEVSKLREEALQKHILQEIGLTAGSKPKPTKEEVSIGTSKKPQTKLLAGIVKRKTPVNGSQPSSVEPPAKVQKTESATATEDSAVGSSLNESSCSSNSTTKTDESSNSSSSTPKVIEGVPYKGNLVCIGVLPGLASYDNSSDSDDDILQPDKDSSDSDDHESPARDLCGRRIVEVDKDGKSSS